MKRSLVLVVVLAACGGSKSSGPGKPGETKAFDDMTKDERKAYMKEVVSPTMEGHFQAFDSSEFSEFNCMTCHGEGAKNGSFEMPNPDLPKMPATPEGWQALAEGERKPMFDFMMNTVSPKMAELLSEEPYNPETGQGFGCMNCHTVAAE